jgi:hypothetical protein
LKFDIDAVRVSADITTKPSGTTSLLLLGPTATPHPPRFERLPSDAFVALTLSGVPGNALVPAMTPLWQSVQQDLAKEFPQTLVDAVSSTMKQLFLTGGPLRFVAGPSIPAKPGAGAAIPSAKGKPNAARFVPTSLGWWAVILDEPFEKWATGIRNLEVLETQVFELTPGEPEKTSRIQPMSTDIQEVRRKGATPFRNFLHLTIRRVPNPEYRASTGEAPTRESLTHLMITGDAKTTYIVGSEQEPLALARTRELMEQKGTPSTTGAWYLEPQSDKHTRALGFATPRGILMPFLSQNSPDTADSQRILEVLASLPNDGNTPVPFEYYSDATQAPRTGHLEFRLDAELVRILFDMAGDQLLQ